MAGSTNSVSYTHIDVYKRQDDAVGDTGGACDVGDAGSAHADLVDGFEGRVDQLRTADRLHSDLRHQALQTTNSDEGKRAV